MDFNIFEIGYLRGVLENRLKEMPDDKMAKQLIERLILEYPTLAHIVGTTTTVKRE